jgi:hypothetical protein
MSGHDFGDFTIVDARLALDWDGQYYVIIVDAQGKSRVLCSVRNQSLGGASQAYLIVWLIKDAIRRGGCLSVVAMADESTRGNPESLMDATDMYERGLERRGDDAGKPGEASDAS